jgi:thiol-disulfide isomerase/thioredoxin
MFRALGGGLALALAVAYVGTHAAGGKYTVTVEPEPEALAQLKAERQGQLNQIKADLKKAQQALIQQLQTASGQAEKDRIMDQYYEVAVDYAAKLSTFAEANAGDTTAADALKSCQQLLGLAGRTASASAASKLKNLMATAKNKNVQGMAAVALGSSSIVQYERTYQKNGKPAAMNKAAEAEALLRELKIRFTDLDAVGKKLDDLADDLANRSVGKTAKEIVSEDIDGKKFKLSDFKGKVVVLYFWGSWCAPCVAMIPHEKKLAARLERSRFAMVGINSDKDRGKAKKYLEEKGITWTQVFDGGTKGPIDQAWRVNHWPTIYVLDAKGVIRYREVREAALDAAVDELLREVPGAEPQP